MSRHTIRWVLAHEPPAVLEDASQAFVDAVREETNGDVDVKLYSLEEYSEARGVERMSRTELVRALADGEIEMAHAYVSALGTVHDRLWALELPFLFRDYDHAEKVLEGPIAQKLMDDMVPRGIRGLAFAYSGGFRIIPTRGLELDSPKDLSGLRVRTAGNPVPEAMFARFGARATAAPLEAILPMAAEGKIDACEITYVRFACMGLESTFDVINQTSHSLFMTMMAVNERFLSSLPEAHREAVLRAGRKAGAIERKVAIREEQRTRERMPSMGVRIHEMPAAEQASFRASALEIYDRFAPIFGEALIDGIRQTA